MTDRLYYEHPYQTEFDSTIVEIIEVDGKQALRLDQSCFYPTSGGQAHDLGQLTLTQSDEILEIADVVAGDAKSETGQPVLHVLKDRAATLETGLGVHGHIDWRRRYDHMQQHSSQHLLSHALDSLLGYETVSVHFGVAESTIDLQKPTAVEQSERASKDGNVNLLSVDQITEVEQYVAEIIFQNIPITSYFVDEDALAHLPLRRPPKVKGQIRIVEIAGLDYSACGGTHCGRSGELGPIKIVKQERQRGNVRLTFLSVHRAFKDYIQKHQIVSELANLFSNEMTQVPTLVQGLVDQNKGLEKRLAGLTEQVLHVRAAELWQEAETVGSFRMVAHEVNDLGVNEAKKLVSLLQEHTNSVILLAVSGGDKLTVIFAKGASPALHMGNLLRSTLAEFGGGGGGKEDFAQGGGVPASTAAAVLTAAVEQVQSSATSV